ncbi:MAG: hypothetical protein JWO22_2585 [Frankiales bacterium]|nr:hypothetical protein [Frankiales bacterium]
MTRGQRALAVVLGLTLLVGALAARHHYRAHQPSGLIATFRVHHVGLASPVGYVELDLSLTGTAKASFTGAGTASDGWRVSRDAKVGPGRVMLLTHDITCEPVKQPPSVRLRATDGRLLAVEVHQTERFDLCNPLAGAQAIYGGSTSLTQDPSALLDIHLVNYSTDAVRVDRLVYPGFAFSGGLPLTVRGRPRAGPLRSETLHRAELEVTFAVRECTAAHLSLHRAVAAKQIERLPFEAAGGRSYLTVPGLESYLETLWRRTCVR